MSGAGTPAQISVGTMLADGTLRLWLAQQAVVKGEAVLTAQLGSVGRLGTSATAVLGWSVTIALALIASLSQALSPAAPAAGAAPGQGVFLENLALPIGLALGVILLAAISCVVVMWPAYWRPPGHAPDLLLDSTYATELEVTEAMALGYAEAIALNARSLTRLEKWLRGAWLLFAASPFVGLAAYVLEPWL